MVRQMAERKFNQLKTFFFRKKYSNNYLLSCNDDANEFLIDLLKRSGLTSFSEVFLHAFICYDWMLKEYENGNEVMKPCESPEITRTISHLRLVVSNRKKEDEKETTEQS